MTIIGTIAWLILIALTWAFVRGGTMKTIREIQAALEKEEYNLKCGRKLLQTDDPEEMGKAMLMIEDAYCGINQLHEELYPHKDRMIQEKIDAEEDDSYDPEPGYRVGQ